ncbi:fimbrial protein [Achromobacter pestifer]|uniref:Fimbrial-type adhesion domain-containing protein n=1 Tax=Achromobacter pestifer TaxID=1353889 RepID=A0A6S6YZV9_9BURK|nr:fimbrial protein [Achromobacter pestifer]CAB3639976.1 hypothetical protein LMG3431_02006 [Achromobacter pestifer]
MTKPARGKTLSLQLAGQLIALAPAFVAQANTLVEVTGFIYAAIPCTVKGKQSNMIEVAFGTVLTSRIDGAYKIQNIQYDLDCSRSHTNALRMRVTGRIAEFGNGLLGIPAQPNIAISLKNGTSNLAVDQWFNFTSTTPPDLKAVLVKATEGSIKAGEFSVGATLVVDYR